MAIKIEIELDYEKLHEQLRQIVREVVGEMRNEGKDPCPIHSTDRECRFYGQAMCIGIEGQLDTHTTGPLVHPVSGPDFGIGEGLPGIADNLTQKIARDIAAIHGCPA